MRAIAYAIIAILLSACGGSAPPPIVSPSPAPAFVADFTAPVGLACTGDVPPACSLPPGAAWGTFTAPASPGVPCTLPAPNACFSLEGTNLVTNPVSPGFPLISAPTFPITGAITVEGYIGGVCPDPRCWGGVVLYNGEGQWRSIYVSEVADGTLRLGMWGPSYLALFPAVVASDAIHKVDITWRAGVYSYAVDDVPQPVVEHDPTALSNPPHVAVFSGLEALTVQSLKVYVTP